MNERITISKSYAKLKEEVVITCKSERFMPTQWEFNKGYIDGYATKVDPRELIIRRVNQNNAGNYSCFGGYRNFIGSTWFVATTKLKVLGKLKLR